MKAADLMQMISSVICDQCSPDGFVEHRAQNMLYHMVAGVCCGRTGVRDGRFVPLVGSVIAASCKSGVYVVIRICIMHNWELLLLIGECDKLALHGFSNSHRGALGCNVGDTLNVSLSPVWVHAPQMLIMPNCAVDHHGGTS